VAVFLRRSINAVTALFAVQFAGGVAVIVNEKLRAKKVSRILDHAGAALLVTDDRLLGATPGLAFDDARILSLDAVDLPARGIDPEPAIGTDLALILYTPGPKGLMLSHANVLEAARTVSDYLHLSSRDTLISLLPFSFDYGLNQLTTSLLVGARLVIQRSMLPAAICKTLRYEKVTGMAGVPLLWTQLSQSYSPFLQKRFPHLRFLTNTGGRFPPEFLRRFRESHRRTDLHHMYSPAEAFRSTYLPPEQLEKRPDSVGKAGPNVEVLIVDADGRICGPGEEGELVHRGAHVPLGYWRDQEATERVLRPHPVFGEREMVIYSGDIVKADEEGYLYLVRRKEQIRTARTDKSGSFPI